MSTHNDKTKKVVETFTAFATAFANFIIAADDATFGRAAPPASDKETETPKPRRRRRAPAPAAPPAERGPSLDDVKKAIAEVIEEFDNEGAFDILEKFGVRKARQLKPEQYADAIAAAKKMLEEDDDPNG